MNIVKVSAQLTEIDERVRIESGPLRKSAVATEELLDDEVTAKHYNVGLPDSMGKPIVLGEEMDYIDWRNRERAFYVYKKDEDERWQKIGEHLGYPSYEAALSFAVTEV